jgi:hypothetical protein
LRQHRHLHFLSIDVSLFGGSNQVIISSGLGLLTGFTADSSVVARRIIRFLLSFCLMRMNALFLILMALRSRESMLGTPVKFSGLNIRSCRVVVLCFEAGLAAAAGLWLTRAGPFQVSYFMGLEHDLVKHFPSLL